MEWFEFIFSNVVISGLFADVPKLETCLNMLNIAGQMALRPMLVSLMAECVFCLSLGKCCLWIMPKVNREIVSLIFILPSCLSSMKTNGKTEYDLAVIK